MGRRYAWTAEQWAQIAPHLLPEVGKAALLLPEISSDKPSRPFEHVAVAVKAHEGDNAHDDVHDNGDSATDITRRST
jgi:hypothetical protein